MKIIKCYAWRAQVIDGYKSKLEEPGSSGAVFFAVCRGKV
jgi:hypothetical protein